MKTLNDNLLREPCKVKVPAHMVEGFGRTIVTYMLQNDTFEVTQYLKVALHNDLMHIVSQLKKPYEKNIKRKQEGAEEKDQTIKIGYSQYRALAYIDTQIQGDASVEITQFCNVCYHITSTCHKYYNK